MSEKPTDTAVTTPQMSPTDAFNLLKDWSQRFGSLPALASQMGSADYSLEGNRAALGDIGRGTVDAGKFMASPIPATVEAGLGPETMRGVGFLNSPILSGLMSGNAEAPTVTSDAAVSQTKIPSTTLDRQTDRNRLTVAAAMSGDKAEWDKAIADAIADENSAINDKFSDVIDRLKSDLHDFQRGKKDIDQLYASYTDASNQIMSQAVIDAEGLAPTDVVDVVGRSYDDAEGALNDALVRIDTSNSPEMAQMMNAELRFFEGSIEQALQSDINMQDALHTASSDYAKSVAQAAWSGDIYNAERSRAEIQIQLNAAIAEQQEELERQNEAWGKAKARAEADAKEMYGEEWSPDRDAIWNTSFEEYLKGEGFSSEMILEMKKAYPSQLDNAGNVATVEDWYRSVQQMVNEKNLAALVMPDGRTALDLWQATFDMTMQNPDRSMAVGMNQLIKNMDFATAHQSTQAIFDSMFGAGQYEIPFSQLGENAASTQDPYYRAMQRLWKWDRDFSSEYDTELDKVRG